MNLKTSKALTVEKPEDTLAFWLGNNGLKLRLAYGTQVCEEQENRYCGWLESDNKLADRGFRVNGTSFKAVLRGIKQLLDNGSYGISIPKGLTFEELETEFKSPEFHALTEVTADAGGFKLSLERRKGVFILPRAKWTLGFPAILSPRGLSLKLLPGSLKESFANAISTLRSSEHDYTDGTSGPNGIILGKIKPDIVQERLGLAEKRLARQILTENLDI